MLLEVVLSAVIEQLIERDVVLVGHGHFSRALIVRWLELPVVEGRGFAFSDPAYSVLEFDRGVAQVKCHNRVPCEP